MTLPVGQRGYTQGSGTIGVNNYIVQTRNPSSLNLGNGQLFQIWENSSTDDLFILTSFYWSGGALNATWDEFKFTGDVFESIIPASGTSPVVPSATGVLNMPAGNGITTVGGTNTLTINMNSPFTGDFTFTSATSGDTETLTISNSSDTASSQAQVLISVAGSTAGDAWAQFSVGSTTSYAAGIDNSDSDTLKVNYAASATISPSSGTNLLTVDGAGLALTANVTSTTLQSATSGVREVLLVQNTSNTASSEAQIVARVAGGTAGDTWNQWNVLGAQSYAVGIDNSDSDRFKLTFAAGDAVNPSTAATAMVVDTSGNFHVGTGTYFGNTFEVVKAGGGSNVLASFINTANAAGDGVNVSLSVQAGGNDATFQFIESTPFYWTMGLRNSDNTFQLTNAVGLGSGNVISITTAGIITMPLQLSFAAYKSVASVNVIGTGAVYAVVCDTELYDIQSAYNNATGTFTAPVAGYYLFSSEVGFTNITAAVNNLVIAHGVNYPGSPTYYYGSDLGNIRNGANIAILSASNIIKLAVNDTVNLVVVAGGDAANNTGVGPATATSLSTLFSGRLLG